MEEIKELIRGCKNNSLASQIALFDKYAPKAKGICLRYLKHNHEAEITMVSAFTYMFSNIDNFKSWDFESWEKEVIIKTCIDRLHNMRPHLFLKQEDSTEQSKKTDLAKGSHLKSYSANMLSEALEKLSYQESIFFNMHFIDELTMESISKLTKMDVPSCEKIIHSAKQNITKSLYSLI